MLAVPPRALFARAGADSDAPEARIRRRAAGAKALGRPRSARARRGVPATGTTPGLLSSRAHRATPASRKSVWSRPRGDRSRERARGDSASLHLPRPASRNVVIHFLGSWLLAGFEPEGRRPPRATRESSRCTSRERWLTSRRAPDCAGIRTSAQLPARSAVRWHGVPGPARCLLYRASEPVLSGGEPDGFPSQGSRSSPLHERRLCCAPSFRTGGGTGCPRHW